MLGAGNAGGRSAGYGDGPLPEGRLATDTDIPWTYRGRAAWWFAAAALFLVWMALDWGSTAFSDDAYISLRYVARALDGEGLTFTAGEAVEGYTHPLWVLMLLPLGGVGLDLQLAARWLGITHLLALGVLWWRLRLPQAGLWVLLTAPAVVFWSQGGLETVAFGFWTVLAAWLAIETRDAGADAKPGLALLAGGAAAASGLMRPEGMGVALLALAWIASARAWRTAGLAVAGFAVPAGGWQLYRWVTYHDLLPNTAYAKLGGYSRLELAARAWEYVTQAGVLELWVPLVPICLALLVLARERRAWLVAAAALPILASIAASGGDHMGYARMLVPVMVIALFAAGVAGASMPAERQPLVWGLFLLALGWQGNRYWRDWDDYKLGPVALMGSEVGRFLNKQLPKGSLVATATAGSIPYFAPRLEFIDTLGLTDRHIARRVVLMPTSDKQAMPGHLKGDGAYVLSRQPDVIFFGSSRGRRTPTFLTDQELWGMEAFRAQYVPWRIEVPIPKRRQYGALPRQVNRDDVLLVDVFLRKDSAAVVRLQKRGKEMPWAEIEEEE